MDLLDIEVQRAVLPALVTCPLCGQHKLRVYHDGVYRGEWFHCRGCHSCGDMIELCAKSWKLRIPETLHKLYECEIAIDTAALTPVSIHRYIQGHIQYRSRILKFWEKAQTHFLAADNPQLRGLQRRFVTSGDLQEGWLQAGGQFIGSAPKVAVDTALNPSRSPEARATLIPGTPNTPRGHGSHIFAGRGWKDVLVIPYCDMPGRIAAFLFVGRNANPAAGDCIFYPLNSQSMSRYEAGLAMFSAALLPPHPVLGTTLFVFDDPYAALKLQLRHMRSAATALPLVASFRGQRGSTQRIWSWLPRQDTVFWSPNLTTELIAQARHADGRISVFKLQQWEHDDGMWSRPPQLWLRQLKDTAMPWAAALRLKLASLPVDAAEQTLLQMEMQAGERDAFVQGCEPELRDILTDVCKRPSTVRRVKYAGKTCYEKNGGWYYSPGDHQICNCVIRVEQTLLADDRRYYRGKIHYRGHEVPFTERIETLSSGVLPWAEHYLRDIAKLPGVLNYHPGWAKKALGLSFHFHDPETVDGVDTVGWHSEESRFNFPNFAIRANGDVTTDSACLFESEDVPALQLKPPTELSTDAIKALSKRNDEVRLIWATAACVASNLVAPLCNRGTVGIVMDGIGSHTCGVDAAKRLGCIVNNVNYRGDERLRDTWHRRLGTHGWPVVMQQVMPEGARETWLDHVDTSNTVTTLSSYTSRVLGIRRTHNIIRCDRQLGSLQTAGKYIHLIIPSYLQYFCEYRIGIPSKARSAEFVLYNMADWFKRQGGDVGAIKLARRMLDYREPWEQFLDLAFTCYEKRKIRHVRASHDPPKRTEPCFVGFTDPPAMWVPQRGFSDVVVKAGGVPPDLLLITESLSDAGVLLDESKYRNQQGWLLKEDFWNEHYHKWES